jgi:hypothetical protein
VTFGHSAAFDLGLGINLDDVTIQSKRHPENGASGRPTQNLAEMPRFSALLFHLEKTPSRLLSCWFSVTQLVSC